MPIEPLGAAELDRLLAELEAGSFRSMTDDDLLHLIRRIHVGFRAKAVTMRAGTRIYRAVPPDPGKLPRHISRLTYPPAEFVKEKGRMNYEADPIFYGAFRTFATCLYEQRCKVGDVYAVSEWETLRQMLLNQFGYTTEATQVTQFERQPPPGAAPPDETPRNQQIRAWQSRLFRKRVAPGDEADYRITIAMRRLGFSELPQPLPNGERTFPGIMYPSVATWLMSDNIALLPAAADRILGFKRVKLVRIQELIEVPTGTGPKPGVSIQTLDYGWARPDGSLYWNSNGTALSVSRWNSL